MKKTTRGLITILLIMVMMTLAACSGSNTDGKGDDKDPENSTSVYPMTIVDDLGNEVTIESEPQTIVSVAPSNTEILFALGLGDKVVGRSEYCNFPAEALAVEVVGGYSGPNTELILDLEPDLVFAANSVPEEAKQLMEASGIKVIIFNPSNTDAVLKNMETVADICNVKEAGATLVSTLKQEREALLTKLAKVEPRSVFIDLGGFISVGKDSYIDAMLKEIKAENIATVAEGQWPTLSVEQIIDADPDVYISLYPSLEELTATAGLSEVAAFKNKEAHVVAWGTVENDIVQRPGPRFMEGLRLYAKLIYPDVVQ